jgi:predicted nucleotidyltransferase
LIYAVISEFNPFHNGHRYLLEQLPKKQGDYIICLMSGSFVQRGEPAAYSKWERAAAAVRFGADVVFELPLPYALSDGDRFAAKGVELASHLGQPVTLAFGTECENLDGLVQLAKLEEQTLSPYIKESLDQGLSYGAARQKAIEMLWPEEASLLRSPNNLLACGYIRACLEREIPFLGIRRSAPHDGAPQGNICSASYIREHPQFFHQYTPATQGLPLRREAAEQGLLTLLKTKSAEQLRQCANISEGLENRILAALSEAATFTDLCDRIKTKRYSHAKLRRALCAAALGLAADLPDAEPPYLRILAFGEQGRTLLRGLKKTATLPLCQSGRECQAANPTFFEWERLATDLWGGWAEQPLPAGEDFRRGAIYTAEE